MRQRTVVISHVAVGMDVNALSVLDVVHELDGRPHPRRVRDGCRAVLLVIAESPFVHLQEHDSDKEKYLVKRQPISV